MDEKPIKNDDQQDQGSDQSKQDSDSVHDAIKQEDTQEVVVRSPQPSVEESIDDLISMDDAESSPGDEGVEDSLPEGELEVLPEDTAQIVIEGDQEDGQAIDEIPDEDLDLDPGAAGGWWAGAPFTPIDAVEDVDLESPLKAVGEEIPQEPLQASENLAEESFEEEALLEEAVQVEDDTQEIPVSETPQLDAETHVIPIEMGLGAETTLAASTEEESTDAQENTQEIPITKGPQAASDDIPTIPPPDLPPDWKPENPNLPKYVSEVDRQATRVTPVAYQRAIAQKENDLVEKTKPTPTKFTKGRRPTELKRPKKPKSKKKSWGCLLKIILVLGFLLILALLALGSFGIYQYFRISSSLPDVDELRSKASQFETTRILDREGNLLYEILDPNAGRRTYVPIDEISPYLIAATIATEDKDFYTNPGFDLMGMIRALWQNYTAGGIYSGASTITQQLARTLLLDPKERYEQTYQRKAREIVLSYEITRQYSKDDILELYLNENNYANLAYGVQAAAETYFNSEAEALNLWQSAFLAGLPQAPSVYNIHTNRDSTLYRQRSVLVLMYELSSERNCIDIGPDRADVCVTFAEATQAGIDAANYDFPELEFNMAYPHWVVYIRSLLEEQFDPQTIYRSGFTIYTTLDPELQSQAQSMVTKQIEALAGCNASNGALLAIDPNTGEVLAMVGSADFHDSSIDGQINMALSDTVNQVQRSNR